MLKIIKDLYPMDRYLLGSGYDKAMDYINKIIPLDIIEVASGTEVGDWTVPQEWIIRDAWVKFDGKKIIDWKKDPLSVTIGSLPIHEKVDVSEFKKHLSISDEKPDATPYEYKFYEKDWGFGIPKNKVMEHKIMGEDGEMLCENGICMPELHDMEEDVGKVIIDSVDTTPKWEDKLPEGEYEVFIDSEYKNGTMKIGVHTIPGESDREVLIFAHLDHPYMANDNLSGVACLVDLAKQLNFSKSLPEKTWFNHTIKIIFCPETIGSIAYAEIADISKVDFVIALDCVGNNNTLLVQKSFNEYDRLNYAFHMALAGQAVDYRKGKFRHTIGSDEYHFNDPLIGIPGILMTRCPYNEYHTSDDTPEIIDEEKLKEVQQTIKRTIEIYEQDFIPERLVKGVIMKSKYGIHTPHKFLNLGLDLILYGMDGKKYLSELVLSSGLSFEIAYQTMLILLEHNVIKRNSGINASKKSIKQTPKQKHIGLSRKTNVSSKPKKAPKSSK